MRERLRRQRRRASRHRTAWRALIPADALAPQWREPMVNLWLGMDSHLVTYPVKGGALINIVAIIDDRMARARLERHRRAGEVLAPLCALVVGGTGARHRRGARTLAEVGAVRPPGHDRKRHGRALLGDAAHPLPPFLAQGGAMAIEDAAVLASTLAAHKDDPAGGMRDYERARKKRIAARRTLPQAGPRLWADAGPRRACAMW